MASPRFIAAVVLSACIPISGFATGFLDSLTPEQRERFGLDRLTPQQQVELAGAIENYRRTGEVVAAEQAIASSKAKTDQAVEEAARQAAEAAVAEYKKKDEPGVIARALSVFKSTDKSVGSESPDRFTAMIPGKFGGWSGRTEFVLDNGQVWRQTDSSAFNMKPQENVPVVVYKAKSGYWRLQILDDVGAWVSVKRVR